MIEKVKVILRDESKHILGLDKAKKVFFGMESFFVKTRIQNGNCLLFLNFAKGHFFVYMLKLEGCENINSTSTQMIDDSIMKYQVRSMDKYFIFSMLVLHFIQVL